MADTESELTFEQWVGSVFDHPVTQPEWHWAKDAEWWDGPSETVIRFLTQLFENCSEHLAIFSDPQLSVGLNFLVSNSCSNHMFALLDATVPWTDRKRCIQSIAHLFEDCFAKRCSHHLSHLDEGGANPLNVACYMWWDAIPIYGQPDDPDRADTDAEFLNVLRQTLAIPHIACQEAALHGLGHWHDQYPDATSAIINDFMHAYPWMRLELRCYAAQARAGSLL